MIDINDEQDEQPVDFLKQTDILGQVKSPIDIEKEQKYRMNEIEVMEQQQTSYKIKIYYKETIWGFSALLTPLFGGILLMHNLRKIGQKKAANKVLITSIIFTIATFLYVFNMGYKLPRLATFINIGGALFLTEFYFKKHFPQQKNYAKKEIWPLLAISVLLLLLLLFIYVNYNEYYK